MITSLEWVALYHQMSNKEREIALKKPLPRFDSLQMPCCLVLPSFQKT